MSKLTEHEQAEAAAALEEVLAQVSASELLATAKQHAFIAGTVMGLRDGGVRPLSYTKGPFFVMGVNVLLAVIFHSQEGRKD